MQVPVTLHTADEFAWLHRQVDRAILELVPRADATHWFSCSCADLRSLLRSIGHRQAMHVFVPSTGLSHMFEHGWCRDEFLRSTFQGAHFGARGLASKPFWDWDVIILCFAHVAASSRAVVALHWDALPGPVPAERWEL